MYCTDYVLVIMVNKYHIKGQAKKYDKIFDKELKNSKTYLAGFLLSRINKWHLKKIFKQYNQIKF